MRCFEAKPTGDDSSDDGDKDDNDAGDEGAEMSPPLLRALARKDARGDCWGAAAGEEEEDVEVEAAAEEDSRRRCLFCLRLRRRSRG
jgi:hypothetical protein